MHINFFSEDLKGKDYSEDLEGETILEQIVGKQGWKLWTGCIWLRIGASGGLL
jgi:hypothetical protein